MTTKWSMAEFFIKSVDPSVKTPWVENARIFLAPCFLQAFAAVLILVPEFIISSIIITFLFLTSPITSISPLI